MTELELGQAMIVYEDPEEGRTEVTVDEDQLLYARDHWMLRSGADEHGNDLMRQIPRDRVHYVERNVERFEERARTMRHRVESVARELRQRLPTDLGDRGRRPGRRREEEPAEHERGRTVPIEGPDEEET